MMLFLHALLCSMPLFVLPEDVQRISFAAQDAGKLPTTWERAQTGEGQGSVWVVTKDETAPAGTGYALAQTAKGPNSLYNVATLKESSLLNGTLTVRLKAMMGELDQGGGLVWRYQDAKNYYVCRFNPLEDNLRVYKVIDGKRTQLGTQEKLKFPDIQWHTLAITQDGDKITCSLNGKRYLQVEDKTITKAGRVGLWTKADAQTRFDGLEIQSKKK